MRVCALLAGYTRLFGYIMMAWLLGIACNLVSTGMFFDLAVRDVEISLAAFTLARLSEIRAPAVSLSPRTTSLSSTNAA